MSDDKPKNKYEEMFSDARRQVEYIREGTHSLNGIATALSELLLGQLTVSMMILKELQSGRFDDHTEPNWKGE